MILAVFVDRPRTPFRTREMKLTIEPLYNIFAPRLAELPALVDDAPLRPNAPIPV